MSDIVPQPAEPGLPAFASDDSSAPTWYPGSGSGPEGETSDGGMQRYIAAVLRHKWLILTLGILGGLAGSFVVQGQEPIYQVTAQIWMQQEQAGPAAPIRTGQLLSRTGWLDLIRSQAVLDSVVRRHHLYLKPSNSADSALFENFSAQPRIATGTFSLTRTASGGYELSNANGQVSDRAATEEPLGEELGFNWVPGPGAAARGPVEFTVRAPGDVAGQLADQLVARLPEGSQFLTVSLTGTDPAAIATTLAGIVDRFEEVATALKKSKLTEQKKVLEEQLAVAARTLAAEETALKDFQMNTATMPREYMLAVAPDVTVAANSTFDNYFALTSKQQQVRADREDIRRALAGADSIDIVTALERVPAARESSRLMSAIEQAAEIDVNRRALLATFTENWPAVQSAQRSLDSLKTSVIPQMALEVVRALEAEDAELTRQIVSADGELREIPRRQAVETQLQRNANIADGMYRDLQTRLANADLAEATAVPDMQVLSRPSVPQIPIQDPRPNTFLMLLAGGFGLGFGLAILRDRFDRRVRYPNEITGKLGLGIIGAVPALRTGRVGATDMALAVESFRSIQLSLGHAREGRGPLAITVTSPGPADGKSFVTSNLAIAFADMGHRTLVIDGDVRRGTLHQLLGVQHKPGLSDHLSGKFSLAEVVQSTRYPLLDVIGCGSRKESAPRLLGSPAMRKLMETVRGRYDVILVDSPPLGACVDPMILGTLTRNLVVILRTGTTDRTMAEAKLDALDRLPVRVLGAILNDVSASGPYRYYSYVGGYEVIEEIGEGVEVKAVESA
jgi:polysaccharide biosynthesis transport protein